MAATGTKEKRLLDADLARAFALLADRGVDLGGEHETKTRKALEFFSERLKATPGEPEGG